MRKSTSKSYQNPSEEEKQKKQKNAQDRYQNLSEEKKVNIWELRIPRTKFKITQHIKNYFFRVPRTIQKLILTYKK